MKQLSLREIQLEELEILKTFAKILNQHGLTYFLYSGTLLGAIRHKGFIPWDDDIDIAMPRPDYEKLIRLIQHKKIVLPEPLEFRAFELGNHPHSLPKVINTQIPIESNSKLDRNLWIDVFPLDGLPENNRDANQQMLALRRYKVYTHIKNSPIKVILHENRSSLNKIIKILCKIPLAFISRKHLAKKMIRLAKTIPYEKAYFCGGHAWDYNGIPLRYRKSLFKPLKTKFEGVDFTIPAGYDEYLSSTYGDYMKLPPKSAQITHEVRAYKTN